MLASSALTFAGNAAWQVTLIALLAAFLGRLFRNGPARPRHLAYCVALVAGVLAPLASLLIAILSARSVQSPTVAFALTPAAPGIVTKHALSLAPNAATVVLSLLAVTVAWRLARLILAAYSTSAVARSSLVPLGGKTAEIAARAAAAIGVGPFRAMSSSSLLGPLTFGLFRPTVVVPAALCVEGAEDLLAAALGHELAHVRRRDFLWNLVFELLAAPLAFHPGAWFLKRRVDETRELACDEMVAGGLVERRAYARCLVRLASAAVARQARSYALGAVAPPLLDERVRRLIDTPSQSDSRLPFTLCLCALFATTVASTHYAFAITPARTNPVAISISASPVNWVAEGISACANGDVHDADEAWSHLNEWERADLLIGCVPYGMSHCDKGFALPH